MEAARARTRAAVRKREQLVLTREAPSERKLWHDVDTPARATHARLLIEDVTLRGDQILVHVRFRGGATETLELGRPLPAWALRVRMPPSSFAHHTDKERQILNERGMLGRGALHDGPADPPRLWAEESLLLPDEIAAELGVAVGTVMALQGMASGTAYDDKRTARRRPACGNPVVTENPLRTSRAIEA